MPASPRLALCIGTASLLLALPTTASAAFISTGWSNRHVVAAAGQVQATAFTAQPRAAAQPSASAVNPIRVMHPDELRAAKAKAGAGIQPAPSRPAVPQVSTGSPSAALFNGLNQPGLSAQMEGYGATPPDSTGAIGPTRYVEMVNQLVGVYDRSNLALLSQTSLTGFVGTPSGVSTSDPQIQWDPQANRFLYAEIGFATGNNFLVFGWTKTADPSDLAGGWCHYGIPTGSMLQDYPKLGHDSHFLIVGSNVYDDSRPGFPFVTANVLAISKPAPNDSTCSSPVTATYFGDTTHLLMNTDGTLAFTPVPGNTADTVANDYIFGAHDSTLAPQSKVMVWHMESHPNAVLVADGDISVGTFAIPAGAPQPGTSYQVDTLDGRLTQAVAHFDPRVGAETYWTQQTIAGLGGRSVVRWYEFAPSLTAPIVQSGQVASATDFIWNAAISPSIVGSDAAIFYNRGSASQLPLIGAQSRTTATPLGQMDPGEVPLGTSSAADQENAFPGNCTSAPCRWGDYSGASPDPANASVVWGSNQLMGPGFFGFAQWTTQNFAITTGATAGPDFSLAASPTSQTVIVGNSTTYTVNISRTGGFTGTVALSSSVVPAGASATFNPASTSGSSSTLTVTTSSGTGTSIITITGTSGSLTRTTTATLVVQPVPTPDFSLSASPSSQTVTRGFGAGYTVSVTRIAGFAGNVTLSAGGLPSGAGATFSPNPAGSNSSMSVITSTTTPTGTYSLTITGVSGSLSHSTSVTLVVQPPPDYSLSASPSSQTVTQGIGTSYTITITPSFGFATTVTLSASGLPAGAGATFNPNPAASTSTMSVTTSASTPAGTYSLMITGVSGSLSHTTGVTLVVQPAPDFSLSASPASQTVTQGNGVGYNINITPSAGFAGAVTLSAAGLPNGASAAFSPNPTTGNSAMWVNTSATTSPGSYGVTITGVSGGLSHNANVTFVVQAPPPPDFSLSASPSSQTVSQGSGISYTVSVTPSAGFAGAVTFSAGGLPSGAVATFSPNPATTSSTMSVTTNATTPFGVYTVTVTGVSGSLSHTTTVTLRIIGSCGTPTLSTSAASPYASGAGPITLTATAQCGGGTEFEFFYKDPNTGWHVIGGGYGTSNTALWNADYTAGNYMFEVDVRPVGSSAAWLAYYDLPFTLTGCAVPSLTPDIPSPQSPGVTVHWTSTVSCTGTPQYLFHVRTPAGAWSIAQPYGASNTFIWNTPSTDGAYLVQVDVRNAGANEDPFDNNTAVAYNLSSCSTPTLSTSAASPYRSGSGPIMLTATGQCGGGTEYEFFYKDPSTGWHVIGSGYGSSNTALWNADYIAGSYMLEVDIRPVGSSATWVAYYDLPFTLSGCGVPSLTPDLPSPQSPGTTVHWTAGVSCTGTPQYLFSVRSPAGVWSVVQPYGASNTLTWNSPTVGGSYLVQVDVRNAGANEDPSDNNSAVTYFLSTCTTPTLSTSGASPYVSGSGPITLTATGQCGGGTQYEFFYRDLANSWHVIGIGYGSSNTALWNADYSAGGYMFEVDIRPVGSSAAWFAYFDLPFTLSGCGVPALSPDLASPQSPGTTVHWTATVSCTGTPQYLFYVRTPDGVWTIAQPWGASNTFTWNSPAVGGSYLVQVNVRNAGANEDPFDNNTAVTYFLSSCSTPTLSTSAASPYPSGNGPVMLTATGQCGGGTEYEFFYRDPSTGWHVIGSGYGSSNTALWNADYAAGSYMLEVDIRPVGSSASWIAYNDLPFTLTGCGVPSLTPDLPSPQPAGTTVHWTASVSCTGTPQYLFYVRTPAGVWSIVQPYGASNTFTWNSPTVGGTYLVQVDVRNAGANEDPQDNNTAVTYNLG